MCVYVSYSLQSLVHPFPLLNYGAGNMASLLFFFLVCVVMTTILRPPHIRNQSVWKWTGRV